DRLVTIFLKGLYEKNVKVLLGSNKDEAKYFTLGMKLVTPEDFNAAVNQDREMIKTNYGLDVFSEKMLTLYPLTAFASPRDAYDSLLTDSAFTCPTRVLADALSENGTDVYLYLFSRAPAERGMMKNWGAFHGAELPFVFGNFNILGFDLNSAENSELSRKVIALWSSFARTGTPAAEGAPQWAPFNTKDTPYMNLDIEISVRNNLKKMECDYVAELVKNAVSRIKD
ncbi:MAG: carboxylesterase family protein, partial [bacterium]